MKKRRVHVHIDRLILRGVAPRQAGAVAAGLRRELERRLFDSIEGLDRGRSIPSLDAGRLEIGSDAAAAEIGRRAATRAVERMRR